MQLTHCVQKLDNVLLSCSKWLIIYLQTELTIRFCVNILQTQFNRNHVKAILLNKLLCMWRKKSGEGGGGAREYEILTHGRISLCFHLPI